jgi:Fic-DOC domain mobile mystery protein B
MTLWSSIPGETPIDPSGLKSKGVTNRRELSTVEAENIRKVFVRYLSARPNKRTAPFTFSWCLRLHEQMFGDVWKWAGKIRTHDGLNIGIRFHSIAENLASLLLDLENWTEFGMDMVEQGARLHHRAVFIHPFENGNGRWSRLLANIWLRRNGYPLVNWPEPLIGQESAIRSEYIAAIRQADCGDYDPIVEMHRRFSDKPA